MNTLATANERWGANDEAAPRNADFDYPAELPLDFAE